jgi:thioredoxin 1
MRSFRRVAALLSVLALAACGRSGATAPTDNLRLIDNARQSGQPTIVEFGSDSCASCRQMKIVLDAVARRAQGRVHVLVMDVVRDGSLLQPYRIQMIPTQVLFDAQGKEVWRHLGPLTEDHVMDRLGLGK